MNGMQEGANEAKEKDSSATIIPLKLEKAPADDNPGTGTVTFLLLSNLHSFRSTTTHQVPGTSVSPDVHSGCIGKPDTTKEEHSPHD